MQPVRPHLAAWPSFEAPCTGPHQPLDSPRPTPAVRARSLYRRRLVVYFTFARFPDYSDLDSFTNGVEALADCCCCKSELRKATGSTGCVGGWAGEVRPGPFLEAWVAPESRA